MNTTNENYLLSYLDYCETQKNLNHKTVSAYSIDIRQFRDFCDGTELCEVNAAMIESYISHMHGNFKPKTIKRKIASLKVFFTYLAYKEIITINTWDKIRIQMKEPSTLQRTIPIGTVEIFLKNIYEQEKNASTAYRWRNALRNTALCDLLFSTELRVSELCSLKPYDINLNDNIILIYEKGSKERRMHIRNEQLSAILKRYKADY